MWPPVDERLYDTIEPELYRYPAIDSAVFRRELNIFLARFALRSSQA